MQEKNNHTNSMCNLSKNILNEIEDYNRQLNQLNEHIPSWWQIRKLNAYERKKCAIYIKLDELWNKFYILNKEKMPKIFFAK